MFALVGHARLVRPHPMFDKILIANRGEIACRVIAHRAPAGRRAPSPSIPTPTPARCTWRSADEAVAIGPAPAAKAICAATRSSRRRTRPGAEAIHPGYGFLSENADFVDQVTAAGLVFIGPPAAAIRAMGLEGRGQAADGEGRRAGGARLSRRGAGARAARRQGARDRLSGADQGARRRRRQGHAPGRRARRLCRGARRRAARGEGRVRRRPRAGREIRREAAPHRGAGVRRQSRQRRAPVRARLLGAAPPPEGDRGGAGARHDAGRCAPR